MTTAEYERLFAGKDHILIRMTDSFPYFKEKYIVENGFGRTETNYHIADGMTSCYINFELHPVPLVAEVSRTPKFELQNGYSCPILITNVSDRPVYVSIGDLTPKGAKPPIIERGWMQPGEVFGIYPYDIAKETLEIFKKAIMRAHIDWALRDVPRRAGGNKEVTMRKYQFTFKMDVFSENGNNGIKGYVDANNAIEIMNELMAAMKTRYASDLSLDEFYDKVRNFNQSERFGSTDITGL